MKNKFLPNHRSYMFYMGDIVRATSTVELVKAFGTTPTVDKGTESQDDRLRRRRQHIARLNIPKSSTNRALSRFIKNSTAIFDGES